MKTDPKLRSKAAIAAQMEKAAKRPPVDAKPVILTDYAAQLVERSLAVPPSTTPSPASPPVTKDAPQRPIAPAKARPAPLVSVPVELLVTVRNQPGKGGHGYAYFSRGITAGVEAGLAVNLNRAWPLVDKALQRGDTELIPSLYGLIVAEVLALRRSESPLVGALQSNLALPLYPHPIFRSQVFSDLAIRLSGSPLLETLKTLPIYGPTPKEETLLVATVTLEVSAAVADAPWKRLSRYGKPGGRQEEKRERETVAP